MDKGIGVELATRSSIEMGNSVVDEEFEGKEASLLRIVETFLRLFPICLCVTALIIMLKNSEENEYGSVAYSDLGAFRLYLVHANGICAGYSLFSAVIVAVPRPSTMPKAWAFFLLDQVQTYIILAAGAVLTEVLYLAEYGVPTAGWSSACGSFGSFCHKIKASLVITFIAVVCYILLSLISSYRLFSKYDAPAEFNNNSNKDIGIAAFNG
ncbi:putative casparian strip membrane protein [Medicago truncatula]|uniref:CASP-like protein n=1 Tax=Medicago truncatula TaxID=3880 RepID=A0A396HW90_MEDTR|nr:putative casparian strip membrane protein [Medicago truncatula]